MDKLILAVVGLPGAGKTEAAEYILQKMSWPHIHFGNIVVDEVRSRGMEVNEANERVVREDLRARGGIGVLAVMNLPKIKEIMETSDRLLIESHYSWEEYLILKENFGDQFKVLAIFSSPETRTRRMTTREYRPLTPEQLVSRDYSQIANLHQAGPIARADWTIVNEGTLEELHDNIIRFLQGLSNT